MIVEEVCLKDFRSHAESRVRLTQGVTVIVGENGSGKSTLLEAVNFALFKNSRRGYSLDALIRRGASLAKVSLVFHERGRRYRVERRRVPGRAAGSSLYELRDGDELLIARGEVQVTREIERILGMNSEVFTSAIYIRQGEIDALLSFEPAEKKKLIGKLLGAEDLERAHTGMREVVGAFKQRQAALEGVREELRNAEEEIEKKRFELGELRRLLENALHTRNDIAVSIAELDGRIQLVEEGLRLLHRKRVLEAELSHLREKLERLNHYAAKLEALREKGERYLALQRRLEELREREKRLSVVEALFKAKGREREEAEAKLQEVEGYIEKLLRRAGKTLGLATLPSAEEVEAALRRRTRELEEAQRSIRQAIEETTREAAKLRGKARETERALKELLAARGSCPVCMSPLSAERKEELSREYRRRSRESVQRAEALERGLEESRVELSYVEKRLAEVNRIGGELSIIRKKEAERAGLRRRLEELEEELRALEEERRLLAPLVREVAELEAEKVQLAEVYEEYVEARRYLSRHAGEEEALVSKLEEAEAALRGIADSLEALGERLGCEVSEELHRELRGKREELQAKLTELEKNISAGEEGVRRVKAEIERLEERIASLREKLQERERLEEFVSLLEKIRGLFHRDRLQRELRRRALPLIEQYTREVFEEFNLPYSELTLNEDFSVTLYGPLGEESAEMLSGGERVALALALRLGIARALSGSALEMIMLDEPTIHLDAQRRQELVEIIKRLTSIPQTIVVTHDKEFEQAADRLLMVEKKAGISRVVEAG